MEGSGKWPDDALAIRHIKAAFHIRLGELLKSQHGYSCRPTPTHLDLWKVIVVDVSTPLLMIGFIYVRPICTDLANQKERK